MAPKLSKTIEPVPYGTPMVPQPPGAAASELPSGLLKANGALVPDPAGRTLSQGVQSFVGKPARN